MFVQKNTTGWCDSERWSEDMRECGGDATTLSSDIVPNAPRERYHALVT
jgi:hypothetical protein